MNMFERCSPSSSSEWNSPFCPEGKSEEKYLTPDDFTDFRKAVFPFVPAPDMKWTSTLTNRRKVVYLTFDDGPKPYATENILDILDKEKVKATFFLIGKKAILWPEIVKEILRRGHTIGNHTFSHIMPWGENYKIYVEDALKGKKVLEEISGETVNLFRPPGGNHRLMQEIEAKGMRVVLWTALSGDCAKGKGPDYLIANIKRQERSRPIFHDPMIILMHDTNSKTAEALPHIIAYLKKRRFIFSAKWN